MIDFDKLRDLIAEKELNIYSVCEYDHGEIRRADFQQAANCRNCYSVAKAFVVTAIGMLEDRGLLHTDDPVYPIFQDRFPPDHDPAWKQVTIAHALTHTIGIGQGFLDIDCDVMPEYGTDDLLSIVLSRKLPHPPGTVSVYSDGAFYLLSRIVTEKTGLLLSDFLRTDLLVPMKFREYAFSTCPQGYPIGATGLYITTDDMLKLGILYLQNGMYGGRQYLTPGFVQKALGRFEFKPCYGGFAKGGMYGQYLYLNRDRQQVIAFHGINKTKPAHTIIMDFLHSTGV